MKVKFVAVNPEELEYRLEMTLTLHQWVKLRAAVDTSYNGSVLRSAIGNMIDQAQRNFVLKDDS